LFRHQLSANNSILEEHQDKAQNTHHSTTKDAAQVAIEANATLLLLGHFSARYVKESLFEEEAKKYFKASFASQEGKWYIFKDLLATNE
jgi:ribonuclease Z